MAAHGTNSGFRPYSDVYELRTTNFPVRVQLNKDASQEEVVSLLEKITDTVGSYKVWP